MNSGFGSVGFRLSIVLVLILGLVMIVPAAPAAEQQQLRSEPLPAEKALPAEPAEKEGKSPALLEQPATAPRSAPVHRFWDRENVLLFSGVAVGRALDGLSTYNMLNRGREEILLPDAVVNNEAGFAALEAAATATSIGVAYLLHRTGHHRLERWLSIGHIGVATGGAIRNYSLETKRP